VFLNIVKKQQKTTKNNKNTKNNLKKHFCCDIFTNIKENKNIKERDEK
jgi:hypothetical protein